MDGGTESRINPSNNLVYIVLIKIVSTKLSTDSTCFFLNVLKSIIQQKHCKGSNNFLIYIFFYLCSVIIYIKFFMHMFFYIQKSRYQYFFIMCIFYVFESICKKIVRFFNIIVIYVFKIIYIVLLRFL